jgi:hypothetical protein
MQLYYDTQIDWDSFKIRDNTLTKSTDSFDAKKNRAAIQAVEKYHEERILRFAVRPFDIRWCYWTDTHPLWMRSRAELQKHCWLGNKIFISRFHCQAEPEGAPFYISAGLFDKQAISRNPGGIPLLVIGQKEKNTRKAKRQLDIHRTETESTPTANLSPQAREYLKTLGITNPDKDAETAGLIWMHALAIGYSATYLTENADGIRQDWPRIPLPSSKKLLEQSATLGRSIANLLDTESEVKQVTAGAIRPELRVTGVPTHITGKPINPTSGHLAVTAGWGHAGKEGVTMPGQGKYEEREYTEEERKAIIEGAKALGISEKEAFNRLGETTFDIYLNDEVFWRNVPKGVWEYYIGGYQVIKKWLSYREQKMLGRAITPNEMKEVTSMARRIAAIKLLEPMLDENYQKVKKEVYEWPKEE